MEELPGHHQMIISGKQKSAIGQVAKVFVWKFEVIE